ncbi:HAD family hydrolase [Altererythrobacter lutimaris]|uniref:HAD family hydrolase n=1 Tax=Altererythrobacter lutimaris TaxID=2743979 RepID=A0A850H764_9SPHN|nr:HAD family hydrolase [Altererythrobacter lutimaris]NVE95104.1 HAD family hydrolase [Altererythrobacter lutimaris]
MTRPLIISDCDEVILHMVAHFKEWLEEGGEITFNLQGNNFATAMRWRESGEVLPPEEIWRYLGKFFDTEMDRQLPIAGAVDGINRLAEDAEVVILTNLVDKRRDHRAEQLKNHGVHARVFTNQGPKGPALRAIIEEYAPAQAIFIDDLAQHHLSVSEEVPQVTRLHLCGDPDIAPHIDCAHEAGHAHARIDQWSEALPWLLQQLEREKA